MLVNWLLLLDPRPGKFYREFGCSTFGDLWYHTRNFYREYGCSSFGDLWYHTRNFYQKYGCSTFGDLWYHTSNFTGNMAASLFVSSWIFQKLLPRIWLQRFWWLSTKPLLNPSYSFTTERNHLKWVFLLFAFYTKGIVKAVFEKSCQMMTHELLFFSKRIVENSAGSLSSVIIWGIWVTSGASSPLKLQSIVNSF